MRYDHFAVVCNGVIYGAAATATPALAQARPMLKVAREWLHYNNGSSMYVLARMGIKFAPCTRRLANYVTREGHHDFDETEDGISFPGELG